MKLLRHGAKGAEKPGLLDAQGQVRDLSGVIAGHRRRTRCRRQPAARCARSTSNDLPLVDAPSAHRAAVERHGQVHLRIGLNYADHAAEAGKPSRRSRSCS